MPVVIDTRNLKKTYVMGEMSVHALRGANIVINA